MSVKPVNLTVNPCKMCMPMGVVTAMYGIKRCITLLHGSQGCSTYIRRHMATHYNEPVDIASTSLTEEGTVYGGERNLIKGLINLIKVYRPDVVVVATTCLAETIGEDLNRMIGQFYAKYPQYSHVLIVPINSPGYGGSQFEGYMSALCQLLKSVPMNPAKNDKVNVITGYLSPADTRILKELLDIFDIDYILLPDLSENLDRGYYESYEKLPQAGTSIEELKKMAGARLTIELSSFSEETFSAGRYLEKTYGVPYARCNLPVGLRDTDAFIRLLSGVSQKEVPEKLKKERARYLDAMIDSHKINSEALAAVYGEPDFVYSTVRLCAENGILPVIAATGSRVPSFAEKVEEEIKDLADEYFRHSYGIYEEIDFQSLEELARKHKVNVLIGNSDGRRLADKLKIDLVRRSFPIHDRLGGQRLAMLGYAGSLSFLDEIGNVILAGKEKGYRGELYRKYYKPDIKQTDESGIKQADQTDSKQTDMAESKQADPVGGGQTDMKESKQTDMAEKKQKDRVESKRICKVDSGHTGKADYIRTGKTDGRKTGKSMEEKTYCHPCFNCAARQYARIHLPVAPKCNIGCNYCVRKYDCPNESRPGVSSSVLKPEEACARFLEARRKIPGLTVAGIAGPGDALANFPETMETLRLIRSHDPEITFCISTNGLMLPLYAEQLVEAGVSHVTVTMNTLDPAVGAKIYRYVDYMGKRYSGEVAAAILIANQMAGIKMLAGKGVIIKVNIIMLKGINDRQIPELVRRVKELGAYMTNIVPMIPVAGSIFEKLAPVSREELNEMRSVCGGIIKQMYHCRQCRADAVGTLDMSHETEPEKGILMAVASKSGILVDQHFGHASEFHVYEYKNGIATFKEIRTIRKYCDGVQDCDDQEDKMNLILKAIEDCKAVLVMRIGEAPKERLLKKGIKVFTTYDRIEISVIKAASEIIAR